MKSFLNTGVSAFIVLSGVLAVSSGVSAPQAFAAGGGGNTTIVTPTCKKDFVWDRKIRKCVKVEEESSLDDESLFSAARDLAYNGRYEEAIRALNLMQERNAPRVLNYLGYSTRKLGDVEGGLVYYQAALKLNPDYTLAREYMGEAYLQLGQVGKAREQLSEIESRCGRECQEYVMLDAEISRYQTQ